VLCLDDPGVAAIMPEVQRPTRTYGLEAGADVRALDVEPTGLRSRFQVLRSGASQPLEITLNLPGQHNVLNALAAIAVAQELEIEDRAVQKALAEFQGIDRRLQVLGEVDTAAGRALFVDDYAHHPTEIAATLRAVRDAWPGRRIVVAFQPHRYSRTRDLLDDFADVLSAADRVLITEVYAAGEDPIAGADGRAICRAVRSRGIVEPVWVPRLDRLPKLLAGVLQAGDVVLTLGAGDIGAAAQKLPVALGKRVHLRRTS
jgi:UDP-N-acetylmuramate--alanine ligase